MPCTAFFSVTIPGTGERKVSVRNLAGACQCVDLLGGDVPVAQPLKAGFGELLHAGGRIGSGQRAQALRGDRVFALGGNEFGAVDLEQGLAAAHRLAGGVHVQPLHITFELGRDAVDATLVWLDAAARAHHACQRPNRGGLGAHAELLDFLGTDAHLRSAALVLVACVHRDVVHPH